MSVFPRELRVTLVCRTLPQIDEPVTVGMQDRDQEVHEGTHKRDGSFEFRCVVRARDAGGGRLDFAGPLVHGRPGARFLYLSWKRLPGAPTLWFQRVKVPLALAAAELGAASMIQADITGRRPHATEPIAWTVVGNR